MARKKNAPKSRSMRLKNFTGVVRVLNPGTRAATLTVSGVGLKPPKKRKNAAAKKRRKPAAKRTKKRATAKRRTSRRSKR